MVEALFLSSWNGSENNVWKQVEGLEKRKTALSDHLLSVFAEWSESFSRPTPNFELSFERFEVLASLVHFEQNEASSVEAALEKNPQQGWTWIPVGRSAWNSSNADVLFNELHAEPTRTALTQAGFANGDPKSIDTFIRNFQSLTASIRW